MYELQNYLTSQSGDSGQLVGSPLVLSVDGFAHLEDREKERDHHEAD